ncbi:hypothetical protein [Allorhizocola rhizosphaerae]|uniref:hypothetical protein n=1 Tax=Allorhizocola rhizosphaerae TaxID=1872709 RepID=UPI000E3C8D23|nr:hypothetical protein [Allorhizocola rhizosphaerae]
MRRCPWPSASWTSPASPAGQVLNLETAELFVRDGDGNQEDITNDATAPWSAMPCFRFEFSDNPGGEHLALASVPAVLQRLINNLQQPKSVCS